MDLDDMLDDALEELEETTPSSSKNTTEEDRAKIVASIKRQHIKYNPGTWQETLALLPTAEEKAIWTETIAADIAAQAKMRRQPVFSTAYAEGTVAESSSGKGDSGGVSAFLQAGANAGKPVDLHSLMNWCARKAIEKVEKKDLSNFVASNHVDEGFKKVASLLVKLRLTSLPDEVENVKSEPERFPNLLKIIT